ncbi:DUF5067 domain-containing protein [Xylocopilactobacillus apis]|uniref:DUF5067 domain-containing protein n=1 Tax=Xylocopilactobacillus apis TaxID=2932183 RepID=A0AAU9D530_9LACO|nr:DUF5067 domain-containing protein [Xylocopilactobacillus apis]BDR56515.1 hypothetical protein KIMC2_10770 [Xylocopilactobacillus apis]
MKKNLTALTILLSTVVLFGCSNTDSKKSTSSSQHISKNKKKLTSQDKIKTQKFNFENKQVDNSEFTIKITKYRVIKPGKKGNKNGKSPVIAFWYQVKNKNKNNHVDPITAWQAVFKAQQLGSNNKKYDLQIAALPDDKYLQSQMTEIKQGKTVENAIAYKLNNKKNSVDLISIKGPFGEGSGKETFPIK